MAFRRLFECSGGGYKLSSQVHNRNFVTTPTWFFQSWQKVLYIIYTTMGIQIVYNKPLMCCQCAEYLFSFVFPILSVSSGRVSPALERISWKKREEFKLSRRTDSPPLSIYIAFLRLQVLVLGKSLVEMSFQCVGQKSLVGVYSWCLPDPSDDRIRRRRDANAGVTTLASSGSALPLSAFRSIHTTTMAILNIFRTSNAAIDTFST